MTTAATQPTVRPELWQPTETELRARRMIAAYREADWSPSRAILAQVFTAMWYASLSADRVAELGAAIAGVRDWDPRPELTRAVRAGVLRSRVISGVRHWEVCL